MSIFKLLFTLLGIYLVNAYPTPETIIEIKEITTTIITDEILDIYLN
jgi:hypothetical protein